MVSASSNKSLLILFLKEIIVQQEKTFVISLILAVQISCFLYIVYNIGSPIRIIIGY